MRTLAYSFFVVLSCAAVVQAETYNSTGGKYEVNVPAAPMKSTKEAATPLGKMKMHAAAGALNASSMFVIVHADLPPIVLALGKPDDFLSSSASGVAAGLKAKVISTTKINLGTAPGREVLAELPGGTSVARVRVYIANGKMYQVAVITAKGSENSAEANAFFASFKIK
jgi:hypothetical protein